MSTRKDDLGYVGWQSSAVWAACLIALYAAVACLPVLMAWMLSPSAEGASWHKAGRWAGLLGFSLIALQFALAGRFKAVDRPFGLDIVMRFHKLMGISAVVLILSHPVLLVIAAGDTYLLSFATPWQISLGKIALGLLAAGSLFALLVRKVALDYQLWRVSHKLMVAVLALGFVHSMLVGHDLHEPAIRAYWWALIALAGSVFIYRNVFVPLWGRRRLNVVDVKKETHDTYSLEFEPMDGRPLPHIPGQFWFLTLHRSGRPSEEHPFTISSSPTGELSLRSTIKHSGDYTNTIGETGPGSTASIEGPYGRFSFIHHRPKAFLFIAGGVGITPILSMLRYLRDTNDRRPVVLIFGNKTEDDIICRHELKGLPDNVKVVHVLSRAAPDWSDPIGYVNAEVISEHAGDILNTAHGYICGPPPMMDTVAKALRSLGFPGSRLHYERFYI